MLFNKNGQIILFQKKYRGGRGIIDKNEIGECSIILSLRGERNKIQRTFS